MRNGERIWVVLLPGFIWIYRVGVVMPVSRRVFVVVVERLLAGGFEGFWKPSAYGEMVINGVRGIVICERVFIT